MTAIRTVAVASLLLSLIAIAGATIAAVRRRIATQILLERAGETMPRGADIGVVIAGNDRDMLRRADAFEPGLRRGAGIPLPDQ